MIGRIHIVPRGDLWGVVREGDDGDITSYMTHEDAVQVAREIAEQENAPLPQSQPARDCCARHVVTRAPTQCT